MPRGGFSHMGGFSYSGGVFSYLEYSQLYGALLVIWRGAFSYLGGAFSYLEQNQLINLFALLSRKIDFLRL